MDERTLIALIKKTVLQVLNSSTASPDGVAVGSAVLWPGPLTKIPKGYVQAAGQNVKINDYPSLYQLYGTSYNSGTPAGSFRIPNYPTVSDSATATVGRWIIRYV